MANRSTRRTVSRPGVSSDGSGSKFVSPFQPPPAGLDFDGDMVLLDPNAYTCIHVCDYFWRVKVPGPGALREVAAVADAKGGAQIQAINCFLQAHLHPEDFPLVLRRMLDPDDHFTDTHYMDLYRQAVTVGTARPFQRSWALPARPSPAGGLSGQNWHSAVYRNRLRP